MNAKSLMATVAMMLLPATGQADNFYGIGDVTLTVFQTDGSRTWNLPEKVTYSVASDFSSSRLLGINLNFHDTIYEDVSHNFEISFGIVGVITGPAVDLNIIPGSDVWQSSTYWDSRIRATIHTLTPMLA